MGLGRGRSARVAAFVASRAGLPAAASPACARRPAPGARRPAVTLLASVMIMTPLAALAGCSDTGRSPASQPSPSPGRTAAGPSAPAGLDPAMAAAWPQAVALVKSMTLPEKTGQLLVAAIPGASAADGGAAAVKAYHLGGVVYFGANISSASQVAALSNGLQRAALAQRPAIPLLIGTDQEGGIVSRLSAISTEFPNQMAAGATGDPALIRAEETRTAQQMRALGLNLDYAPVADVNVDPANPVIGVRSFGADPALAAGMTAAAVDGFHAGGVAAVAKHFPGHGDTNVDSHTGLPVIHHTLRQWWRIDAPPFQAAIKAGVDEIMIAHIVVPALDSSGEPASLSHRIVTGYLRNRLGYQGVVTTDSLQMGGVLQGHTNAQVAVDAIRAGCDQLLMPASISTAYHALLRAVRAGTITTSRLDTSVTRILALKISRGLLGGAAGRPMVDPALAAQRQNTSADRRAAVQLADRSITVVSNHAAAGRPVLPLAGKSVYLADPAGAGMAGPLASALARTGGHLVASPSGADVIVVATENAVTDPAQRSEVANLAATGRPVVVVALELPYDLGLFRQAAAEVASYSSSAVSLAAAAEVLTGELRPSGRLPVAIPDSAGRTVYPLGAGLRL